MQLSSLSWLQPAWVSSATHLLSGYSPLTRTHPLPAPGQSFEDEQASNKDRNHIHFNRKAIPPEILHLILQYTQFREASPCDGSLAVEIRLSHVSFSWRALCLSSSDLWTKCHVEQPSPISHNRLKAYLQRSGHRLVELTFNLKSIPKQNPPHHEIHTLLHEALAHRGRWRKFALVFEGAPQPLSYIEDFLTPSQTPNLESLIILPRSICWKTNLLDGFFDTDPTWPKREAFCLCLNGNSAQACSSSISQATDLRLDASWSWHKEATSSICQSQWITWNAFQRILSLPSLSSLSLQGQPFSLPDVSEKTPKHTIEMPHVRHLRYASCEGSSAFEDFVLPSLNAPALETLTLERMDPPDDPTRWTPENIQNLPSVHTLHLVGFIGYDDAFTSCLSQLTPSVTHLVLTGGQPVKTVLSHVARQGLWKSMEKLTIHGPHRSKSYIGREVIQKALDLLMDEQRAGPTTSGYRS